MHGEIFVSALIAAAGQGKRMKSNINKQYIKLLDKPLLVYTLKVFENVEEIDEIVLILKEDEIELCREEIINKFNFKKKIKIVPGGSERQESIYNGLSVCNPKCEIVVTHDGARPFITEYIIKRSIDEAIKHGAIGVGMPVKDTIKIVDEKGKIIDTPDRRKLWMIQTPQTFEHGLILKAHEMAKKEGFLGTDDSVLVERIGKEVKMIEGSYENIKVTTPEDICLGEAIIKRKMLSKDEKM